MQLVAISGSLRGGSFNKALLANAAAVMPAGAQLEIAGISDIPLFNQDLETEFPAAVTVLKERVAAADGLVFATPEYNGGIPGVAKNVIDWLSRPAADQARVLHGKPVALLGATPGGMGTVNAQSAWLPIFRALRMRLWVAQGGFMMSGAGQQFDADGNLIDSALRDRLAAYLQGFVASIGA